MSKLQTLLAIILMMVITCLAAGCDLAPASTATPAAFENPHPIVGLATADLALPAMEVQQTLSFAIMKAVVSKPVCDECYPNSYLASHYRLNKRWTRPVWNDYRTRFPGTLRC